MPRELKVLIDDDADEDEVMGAVEKLSGHKGVQIEEPGFMDVTSAVSGWQTL